MAHTSNLHVEWETMHYLLLPIWTKRSMVVGHLPKHVPSAMPHKFASGEELCIMQDLIPLVPI
jgi:hypothetical protein